MATVVVTSYGPRAAVAGREMGSEVVYVPFVRATLVVGLATSSPR
jgi:hypothetical protein